MSRPGNAEDPELLFEQYKLIAEDLSRTREQRDRAIRTYITINSIILAAFGLLLRGPLLNIAWWQALLIVVPLLLVGVVASLQWAWRLEEFKILVNQRLVVLERIERNPMMVLRIHSAFNQAAKQLGQRNTSVLKYTYELPILPYGFLAFHVAFFIVVLAALWLDNSTNSSLESTVSTALLFGLAG